MERGQRAQLGFVLRMAWIVGLDARGPRDAVVSSFRCELGCPLSARRVGGNVPSALTRPLRGPALAAFRCAR